MLNAFVYLLYTENHVMNTIFMLTLIPEDARYSAVTDKRDMTTYCCKVI